MSEERLNPEKSNRLNNRPPTATSKSGVNGGLSIIMGTNEENFMFNGGGIAGIQSDDEKQTNKGRFTKRKSMLYFRFFQNFFI